MNTDVRGRFMYIHMQEHSADMGSNAHSVAMEQISQCTVYACSASLNVVTRQNYDRISTFPEGILEWWTSSGCYIGSHND